MKKFLRYVGDVVIAFGCALLLASFFGWVFGGGGAALAFLAGWPVLTWRRLRRQARPEGSLPPQARPPKEPRRWSGPAIIGLIILPFLPAGPLIAFIKSCNGYAGVAAGFAGLALLIAIFVFCWGTAFVTFAVRMGRKKPKAPEA